jgi:hypothetical protein
MGKSTFLGKALTIFQLDGIRNLMEKFVWFCIGGNTYERIFKLSSKTGSHYSGFCECKGIDLCFTAYNICSITSRSCSFNRSSG